LHFLQINFATSVLEVDFKCLWSLLFLEESESLFNDSCSIGRKYKVVSIETVSPNCMHNFLGFQIEDYLFHRISNPHRSEFEVEHMLRIDEQIKGSDFVSEVIVDLLVGLPVQEDSMLSLRSEVEVVLLGGSQRNKVLLLIRNCWNWLLVLFLLLVMVEFHFEL
jgi:hypothetical protein